MGNSNKTHGTIHIAVDRPSLLGRVVHRVINGANVFPEERNESTFLGLGPSESLPITSRVDSVETRDKTALFDAFVDARKLGVLRQRNPFTHDVRMSIITEIAMSFPALQYAAGIEPWQPLALMAWLNGYARYDEQARTVAAFLLMLWNPWADWRQEGWEGGRPFNIMFALDTLSPANLRALAAWIEAPVWP